MFIVLYDDSLCFRLYKELAICHFVIYISSSGGSDRAIIITVMAVGVIIPVGFEIMVIAEAATVYC